ncbi:hypothetical protein E4U42_007145, partial [Claviceps africana]
DHSARTFYAGGDLVTPEVDGLWSRALLAGAPKDYFNSASLAPRSWLAAFPVTRLLVCAGGSEIMLPAIEDFAEKLQVGKPTMENSCTALVLARSAPRPTQAALPNVEFFVGPREGHVAPVYNLYVGDRTETQQGKRVKAWLREVV